MRRFSLCAIFLALAGSIVAVVVVSSWAADPQPAAKENADLFGDGAPAAAKRSAASAVAAPQPPKPPVPPTEWTAVREPKEPPASLRVLPPELAAAPQSLAVVDASADADSPAVARICAALAAPADKIDFVETPLKDVVDFLKSQHKIEIQLDLAGLKDAGVDENTPVTKTLSGVSLHSALHLILEELQLKYVIHNEVLLITSPQKAESDEFLATRLYPVKDLILVRGDKGEIETDFQPLIDLVTNTVAQKSWLDNGGTGTISSYQFQDRCLLAICQTQEVHEQIADLLAALRKSGGAGANGSNGGKELLLPKRPKYIASTYHLVPSAAAPARGTDDMGIGRMGWGSRPDFEHGGGAF